MSQFFRKGGIALNDTEWIQDFADRRLQYGVSQTKLAVMAGISREHLSRIESGKVAVTEEMKVKLLEALEKFNPEAPLTMLFDYVVEVNIGEDAGDPVFCVTDLLPHLAPQQLPLISGRKSVPVCFRK